MSKTDTIAPLVSFLRETFVFRRTVQFATIFAKTGRSLFLFLLLLMRLLLNKHSKIKKKKSKITTPRGVLERGVALASAKFAHGVHAHGSQPCSEPQCSVAALPSNTSVCTRGEAEAVALSARCVVL